MKTITITILALLTTNIVYAEVCTGKLTKLDYFVGKSMEPTIKEGDKVYYKRTNGQYKPQTGEISILKYKGVYTGIQYEGKQADYIVHRIIGKTKNKEYVTQGDNNEQQDTETFKQEQIVGIVCKIKQ